jgi:hypothetical protein
MSLNARYFESVHKERIDNKNYEGFKALYNPVILYSELDGTPLACMHFVPQDDKNTALSLFTERPKVDNIQFFQGMVNKDKTEFQLVMTNLSNMGHVHFQIIKTDSKGKGYKSLSEINTLPPNSTYAVQCDQENNKSMILSVIKSDDGSAKMTIAEDEKQSKDTGEKTQGTYFTVTIVPEAKDKDLCAQFKKTVWKQSNYFVRTIIDKKPDPVVPYYSQLDQVQVQLLEDDLSPVVNERVQNARPHSSRNLHYDRSSNRQDRSDGEGMLSRMKNWFTRSNADVIDRIDTSQEKGSDKFRLGFKKSKSSVDVNKEIESVKKMMRHNVNDVLERAETLDKLEDKAEDLSGKSVPFYSPPKSSFSLFSKKKSKPVEEVVVRKVDDYSSECDCQDSGKPDLQNDNYLDESLVMPQSAMPQSAAAAQPPPEQEKKVDYDMIMNSKSSKLEYGKEMTVKSVKLNVTFDYTLTSVPCMIGLSVQENLVFLPKESDESVLQNIREIITKLTTNKYADFLASKLFKEDTCSICLEDKPDTVFYSCGHLTTHDKCAEKLDKCPLCRAHITAKLKMAN